MDKNNNKERLHVGENRGFWGLWGLLRVAALFVSLATLHYTLFFYTRYSWSSRVCCIRGNSFVGSTTSNLKSTFFKDRLEIILLEVFKKNFILTCKRLIKEINNL